MDNQHKLIKGYKELSQAKIDLMNEVKAMGRAIDDLLVKLAFEDIDERWLSIGRTDLQKGLMAVTRSIAQPDFF